MQAVEPRFILALSYETRLFTSSFDRLSEYLKENPLYLNRIEVWLHKPKRADFNIYVKSTQDISDLLLVLDNGAMPSRHNAVRDLVVNLIRASAKKARDDIDG